MVSVVKFSFGEWVDKIRPRLVADGIISGSGLADQWESIGATTLRWAGAFEREATLSFCSSAQAMWFSLKYLGE